MTIYQCSTCSSFHSSEQPPCPQVIAFTMPLPALRVRICEHCGDTPLADNGKCPVCSQQVTFSLSGRTSPLSIIRGGSWRMRRQRGRSAGPRGKHLTCAVVDESDEGIYGEYLTACGDVVLRGCSVWSKAPTCPACRRALRASAPKVATPCVSGEEKGKDT